MRKYTVYVHNVHTIVFGGIELDRLMQELEAKGIVVGVTIEPVFQLERMPPVTQATRKKDDTK